LQGLTFHFLNQKSLLILFAFRRFVSSFSAFNPPAFRPFFFPVRFGIAKVETFLLFANFIFFNFIKLFSAYQLLFFSFVAGCKDATFLVICQVKFHFILDILLVAKCSKNNRFSLAGHKCNKNFQPCKNIFAN